MQVTDNINHIIINGGFHVADLTEFFAEHETYYSDYDERWECRCGDWESDWPTHMKEAFIWWIKNL